MSSVHLRLKCCREEEKFCVCFNVSVGPGGHSVTQKREQLAIVLDSSISCNRRSDSKENCCLDLTQKCKSDSLLRCETDKS